MSFSPIKSTTDFATQLKFPLRLDPANFTHNMWGGDWIPKFKNIPAVDPLPIGESWEFSIHRDRPNIVLLPGGEKIQLNELTKKYPESILGSITTGTSPSSPFLLKFVDSKEDLSLQVHPSDQQAQKLENDSGKSEAWIILDVDSSPDGGFIYIGFNNQKRADFHNSAEFEEAFWSALSQANSLGPTFDEEKKSKAARLVLLFLNKVRVKAGDIFRVNPGTLHAIGRGVRLFEIQQTSDITYRVWDWNRPDAQKHKQGILEFRALHTEKARQVVDFSMKSGQDYRGESFVQKKEGGVIQERLFLEQEHRFAVDKISLMTSTAVFPMDSSGRFFTLTSIEGSIKIFVDGENQNFEWGHVDQGHTILVPAAAYSLKLRPSHQKAVVLKSYVP